MVLKSFFLFFISSFFFDGCSSHKTGPVNLRCEYLINPIGIDVMNPRFSWILAETKSDKKNIKQKAYQLQVGTAINNLLNGEPNIWDSGFVISSRSIQIPYEGIS